MAEEMKKLKDINWNQVYYFYEVARKMSMKEAAEVTGVSIPTVSEQIKRLETLLETTLFHHELSSQSRAKLSTSTPKRCSSLDCDSWTWSRQR